MGTSESARKGAEQIIQCMEDIITQEEYETRTRRITRNLIISMLGAGVLYVSSVLWVAPNPERTTLVRLAEAYSSALNDIDNTRTSLHDITLLSAKENQIGRVQQSLEEASTNLSILSRYERENPEFAKYQEELDTHKKVAMLGGLATIVFSLASFAYAKNRVNKLRKAYNYGYPRTSD